MLTRVSGMQRGRSPVAYHDNYRLHSCFAYTSCVWREAHGQMYGGGKGEEMLEDKCEGVRYNSTTNERNRNRMKGMVLENNTVKR